VVVAETMASTVYAASSWAHSLPVVVAVFNITSTTQWSRIHKTAVNTCHRQINTNESLLLGLQNVTRFSIVVFREGSFMGQEEERAGEQQKIMDKSIPAVNTTALRKKFTILVVNHI